MTMLRPATALTVFLLIATPASSEPLVIVTSTDAAALAGSLLGAGVTLVGGSASLTGTSTQQGTFTGGTGILPFDTGVILTTGLASTAAGPNSTEGASFSLGTAGNANLTTLASQQTFDANVLSFNFIPTTNVVSFQFVFASEEYHEFVDQFNDVFAFYLNGTNIGVLPGTATPITINTVNCVDNSAFYQPNSASSPCSATGVNTQYDGLAGGLFAQPLFATGPVNVGVSNSLVLAIADAGDSQLDSAVFIGGSSVVSVPTPNPIPEPTSMLLLGTGLAGVAMRMRRRRTQQ